MNLLTQLHVSPQSEPTGKVVALKITRRRFASAALHEAGIHQRLEAADAEGNGHVTRLEEAFVHEGHVGLAFELHGRALSRTLRKGRMELTLVKKLTRQLLTGLEFMHGAGVIHTDVKPDNILYHSKKGVRLADLGLSETSLSAGEPIATQDYAPPEALFGVPMGTPVDMWALGCTVFEMLTGTLLFDPWTACCAKYREFSDDDSEEDSPSADVSEAPAHPSREELDTQEEKREQFRPGAVLGGKYKLIQRLGQGKFATVWKAVILNETPLKLPSRDAIMAEARARRASLPPLPPKARWNLYDVAQSYEHLVQMHELLGPAPSSVIQGHWQKLFCDESSALKFCPQIGHRPLLARLAESLNAEEAAEAAKFLEGLLRYDPLERITAAEALLLPWVR